MRGTSRRLYVMITNGPAPCGYGIRYQREAMFISLTQYVTQWRNTVGAY